MKRYVHGEGYGSRGECFACNSVHWDIIPHDANLKEFKRLQVGTMDIPKCQARVLTRNEIEMLYPGGK